jgi:hypothetical protein
MLTYYFCLVPNKNSMQRTDTLVAPELDPETYEGCDDGEYGEHAFSPPANLNVAGHTCSYGMAGFISGSEASTPHSPAYIKSFDLSPLSTNEKIYVQAAIDSVNSVARLVASSGNSAWDYVAAGNLLKDYRRAFTFTSEDIIPKAIFADLAKQSVSGFTVFWVINVLTCMAKNYDEWRATYKPSPPDS